MDKLALQDNDHCIIVVANMTFKDEPHGTNQMDIINFLEDQFALELENPDFHDFISPSIEREFRSIYSATPVVEATISPTKEHYQFISDDGPETYEIVEASQGFDPSGFDSESEKQEEEVEAEGWWRSNTAYITAGVCGGALLVGIVSLFVYRRRHRTRSGKSIDEDATSVKGGHESQSIPESVQFDLLPAEDLERGKHEDISSKGSSCDGFSLAESECGDHSSSSSFELSDDGSLSDDESRGSSVQNRIVTSAPGSTSVSEIDDGYTGKGPASDRHPESRAMSFRSSSENASKVFVMADDKSSVSSSGWDSSNDESSLDSGVESLRNCNVLKTQTTKQDKTPAASDIVKAIDMGDWTAVGATAAILASSRLSSGSCIEGEETSYSSGSDVERDVGSSASPTSVTESDIDSIKSVGSNLGEERLTDHRPFGDSPASRIAEPDPESACVSNSSQNRSRTSSYESELPDTVGPLRSPCDVAPRRMSGLMDPPALPPENGPIFASTSCFL